MESLSRDLLVVNQVQQQQQLVEADKKKSAVSEQYEMMCQTYRRERDGTLIIFCIALNIHSITLWVGFIPCTSYSCSGESC